MVEKMIQRINELAQKAKSSGLTDEEIAERDDLRQKYIKNFRASMRNQLDAIKYVEDEDQTD